MAEIRSLSDLARAEDDKWLSVDEVASLLAVSSITIRRMIIKGQLAGGAIGGVYRSTVGCLITYLETELPELWLATLQSVERSTLGSISALQAEEQAFRDVNPNDHWDSMPEVDVRIFLQDRLKPLIESAERAVVRRGAERNRRVEAKRSQGVGKRSKAE